MSICKLIRNSEYSSLSGINNQRNAPYNYKKVLISSSNAIYLTSPIYGLKDYNRSVFFENTPSNIEKAELINQLIIKQ